MSQFQSVVRRYQAAGIVGEIAYDGPQRIVPGSLSGTNDQNAYIGRFFTLDADTGQYTPGGTIDGVETLFGGIAITPKELVSFGNSTQGPLGATLSIAGQQVIEFMEMGYVWLSAGDSAEAQQGMRLAYTVATGEIQLVAGNTGTDAEDAPALPEGTALVPNAVVSRTPLEATTGGMYVAKLSN